MALLIFYVSLALVVSFLCSIIEAVLLSVSPSFAAELTQRLPTIGGRLRALKNDIDRPLAAILSLNTIAHTVGAAGAGAQAAMVFGDAYIGVISAILTLLILVISEIIPKTLGAVYWRRLTPLVVRMLVPIIWSMWPLVKMAQVLTRLLAAGNRHVLISREEFAALAEAGASEGVFGSDESRIIRNLFRMGQVRARDIMTPRTVVFMLPTGISAQEALGRHTRLPFSRIPVFSENPDRTEGFVMKVDILQAVAGGKGDTLLRTLKRPLHAVPADIRLRRLFQELVDSRNHIALVVDEYGGMQGVVTLEDVLETIIGLEIVDEVDSTPDMQELARKRWAERARRLGLSGDEESASEVDFRSGTGSAERRTP